MAFISSTTQGCAAVAPLRLQLRAGVQQQANQGQVTIFRGPVQGCIELVVACVELAARDKKQRAALGVALLRSIVQRRKPVLVLGIFGRSRVQQQAQAGGVTKIGC